ncbi:DUF7344 domain-containing protein [Halosolutus gelatinilyticus]|uniref:DUF7344 domain-containing protein n=1 Tax=Halosolutus gelatinilyticus TaxID=2931975 RepID=UPI001FF23452|nr:ArsR family transcriptional regulator [Halosolutus gelatinilyticus]
MIPSLTDPESLTSFGGFSASETGSALDLLANRRRRSVLRLLRDRPNPVSLADLAERVAIEEREADGEISGVQGAVPTADLRRVEISLRHAHVPTLADAGAVAFDTDENVVSLTDEGRTLLDRSTLILGPNNASTTPTTLR